MKIVVPLNNIDSYEVLQDAGADEFYCGFVPYAWNRIYGAAMPFNRREWFVGGQNINSWDTMKLLQEKVDRRGVPVKITLNSRFYVPEQYGFIAETIDKLLDIGYTTFILNDIGLLTYLKQQKIECDIHLSGVAGIRNHLAVEQLGNMNIRRIVFPRKTSVEDMKMMIEAYPDLEYEVFVLNERCMSSEEYCNSLICEKVNTLCTLPHRLCWKESNRFAEVKRFEEKFRKLNSNREDILKNDDRLGIRGCGLCMLEELQKVGVTHLKVVGRMLGAGRIGEDVSIVKGLLNEVGKDECYESRVKDELYGGKCPTACYFLKS